MSKLERITKNLAKIEELLASIHKDIQDLGVEDLVTETAKGPKKLSDKEIEALKEEYQRLYDAYLVGNITSVEEFVNKNTKDYLMAFLAVNNLMLSKGNTKKEILNDILKWMSQIKAINRNIK
jgi:L-arabinose isomerase